MKQNSRYAITYPLGARLFGLRLPRPVAQRQTPRPRRRTFTQLERSISRRKGRPVAGVSIMLMRMSRQVQVVAMT